MRLIFMGTPTIAVPVLDALLVAGHEVAVVYTQPPRPAGRGKSLRLSPVHEFALARGLEVRHPVTLKDPADQQALAALHADAAVVIAYGLLLPRAVLAAPRLGCFNLHASLLPRWRGAAPIQAAVLAGDAQTGVALMRLDEGLDTGPVAAMRAIDIGPADTAGDLHDRLALLGAELLMTQLTSILDGSARFVAQPAAGATHAGKISKADAVIDWRESAVVLDRRIRAYNPWPVAETRLDGAQLRCWLARPLAGGERAAPPGTVLAAGPEGIDVQTGDGLLRLLSVQLAGRQRIAAGQFANGVALGGRVLGA